MRRWCFSLIFLLMAMFADAAYADSEMTSRVLRQKPTLDAFDMCHGGGCAEVERVSLSDEEWALVNDEFNPLPENAEEERNAIANAIGAMERIVGAKTGTDTDRGGTFGNSAYPGQLDCNDESVNSTTYMKLMLQAGLIQFHEVLDTKTRNFFFNGWPHTTAVIRDKQNGQLYAVDSWFYDNGVPAVILPLEVWQSGWRPSGTSAH
jgi:hypothetical protein